MTLRSLLILAILVSFLLLLMHSSDIIATFQHVIKSTPVNGFTISLIIAAIVLQITGHILRSKKATILFNPIESSKVSTQLRAFGVGQLFNNLLPLRLGEFVRTAIISQKLNISYLYTFTLIVFERALDVIFIALGAIFVILIATGAISTGILTVLVGLLLVGVMGVCAVIVLKNPPRWILKFIYITTRSFNDRIKNLIRFKLWSLSYGLNRSISRGVLNKYVLITTLMWLIYLTSIFLISLVTLGNIGSSSGLVPVFAPYVGIAAPAGPAGLGSFSSVAELISGAVVSGDVTVFVIMSWFIILVPISAIGVLSVFKTKEPVWKRRRSGSSDSSLVNKVIRNEDVSGELEHFLEGYFKGNEPSLIVNRLEAEGSLHLVRYFRGGSDAITILVLQNGRRVVKKIIPIELKDRLKAQYDWLRKYNNDIIVKVSKEVTADDYYSIDIAYDKTSVSMFEYVHEIPLEKAQRLLASAWKGLDKAVYSGTSQSINENSDDIERYIDTHITSCVEKAIKVQPGLKQAIEPKKIIVNGIEYDNLNQILRKIKQNKRAWSDISKYRSTGVVHGDMIMDNLLYSHESKKVIIIDPAPDGNIVNGPVFDFAKAAQSLYCGYEFLLRDETLVEYKNNEIAFHEGKSLRFSELDIFMREILAKEYLSEGEQRAILFHAGVLFLRRLKHQVHYTPENTLKFYAVGIRTLNQFLEQYS